MSSRAILSWAGALIGAGWLAAADVPPAVHEAFPEAAPAREWSPAKPVPLSLRLPASVRKAEHVHALPPLGKEEVEAADRAAAANNCCGQPGPKRVGLERPLPAGPLKLSKGAGTRHRLDGGETVWTLALRSPGAFRTRVHFTNLNLGSGQLLIYAERDWRVEVQGPFTGLGPDQNGHFWSPSLSGDTVFLEVSGTDEFELEINQMAHFDHDFTGQNHGTVENPLGCHLDVMCYGVNAQARDAVGHMHFHKDGRLFVCSGTLLTDLDSETRVPYFLTAYHCLSEQAVVDTLEVLWLYQRDSCGGSLPDAATLPRNNGGTLLQTSQTYGGNDMTFIRLKGTVPANVTTAGWTTDYSNTSYGIHHPDGSWKRVTYFEESSPWNIPACAPFSFGFHFVRPTSGIVEGGSSGSPLLNSAGQVMGQLYGWCGDVTGVDCGTDSFWYRKVYGSFSSTYPNIRGWLEFGGTFYVDQNSPRFPGSGTSNDPYRMVNFANNAAFDGAQIKIRPGFYVEGVTFSKDLTIKADGGPVTIGIP